MPTPASRVSTILRILVLAGVGVAGWRVVSHGPAPILKAVSDVGIGRLLSSSTFALIGMWASWRSWLSIAAGMQEAVGVRPARRLFFVSQLGKYLPGGLWPVVMQAREARSLGWRPTTIAVAYLLALAVSALAGVVVATAALGISNHRALGTYWWAMCAAPVALILLCPPVLPALLSRGLGVFNRPPLTQRLGWAVSLRALGWALVMWGGLGLHIALLAGAFAPLTYQLVAQAVGAMSLAFVAGLIVVVAPAGLGVREALLVLTLGATTSPVAALTVALLSRVTLLLGDVILAGWFAFRGAASSHAPTDISE